MEFLFALPIVVLILGLSVQVLFYHWRRFRCARLAFENTHRVLMGKRMRAFQFRSTESLHEIRGTMTCGALQEEVRFQKLEGRFE